MEIFRPGYRVAWQLKNTQLEEFSSNIPRCTILSNIFDSRYHRDREWIVRDFNARQFAIQPSRTITVITITTQLFTLTLPFRNHRGKLINLFRFFPSVERKRETEMTERESLNRKRNQISVRVVAVQSY